MSGGRRGAQRSDAERGRPARGAARRNNVRHNFRCLAANRDGTRCGERSDGPERERENRRHRRRRPGGDHHHAVTAGTAERRSGGIAAMPGRLLVAAVRRGDAAARAKGRPALTPLTVPRARWPRGQQRQEQQERSQYSDGAAFQHGLYYTHGVSACQDASMTVEISFAAVYR